MICIWCSDHLHSAQSVFDAQSQNKIWNVLLVLHSSLIIEIGVVSITIVLASGINLFISLLAAS